MMILHLSSRISQYTDIYPNFTHILSYSSEHSVIGHNTLQDNMFAKISPSSYVRAQVFNIDSVKVNTYL